MVWSSSMVAVLCSSRSVLLLRASSMVLVVRSFSSVVSMACVMSSLQAVFSPQLISASSFFEVTADSFSPTSSRFLFIDSPKL